ncbi:AbrB family transcriptional regulator [Saccharospirillum sp.]|uniref:AbrB family transcriptional regulator n=1 Tax=Saccharospirillum sp. TaxID=2033801 RepID=UPI0034A02D1C
MLFSVSGLAGLVFSWIGIPLPWMIGPLVSVAILTVTGTLEKRVPIRIRSIGQVIVATFIGAHFTPDALHSMLRAAPLLIGVSLYILVASLLVAQVQARLFGTDRVTGFLSVVPISPVEAGILAELHHVATAPIIFAQTVRIALLVIFIPFMLYVSDPAVPAIVPPVETRGLVGLVVTLMGATAGPLLFMVLKLNNPFFLGPLLLAAVLSALDLPSFSTPQPVLALAQVILGTWLGSCFRRELLVEPSKLVASVLLSTALLLILCLLGASLVAEFTELPFATLVLGFAPGATTEMALMAGLLGLDVAFVTAMHLTRIFIIMPNVSWITRMSHPAGLRAEKLRTHQPSDRRKI